MTPRYRLSIPQPLYEAMLAHARADLPAECCGLLAGVIEGDTGKVTHHFPLVNALASPTEFESEPLSKLAAHKAMRASGTEELAVYHSHPATEPIPSERDLERNYGETVMNIIIGLKASEPDVRGWWLTEGGAEEAVWELSRGD